MPDRISAIAQDIRNQCSTIMGAVTDARDAREAAQEADQRGRAQRETIMSALAMRSRTDNWTETEVKKAVKLAASAKAANGTATDKTLATFIGEVKVAAMPHVREFVPAIIAARDEAWNAESEEIAIAKAAKAEAPPTPLRKAFARSYHLLNRLLKEADKGNVITDADKIVDYAIGHDPDHDAERVAKRLSAIVDNLRAFHDDFPVADIMVCIDALASVSTKELAKARDAKLAGAQEETTTVVVLPVAAPVAREETPQPMTGVVDMDALLDEIAA